MKKCIRFFLVVTIFICMVMALSACGTGGQDNQNDSSTDKTQTGGILETIENNTENMEFGENLKWPTELMANLPQPTGKITAVLKDDSTKGCTVAFSGMTKEEAQAYVAKIKALGYSNGMEMADEDSIIVNGTVANGGVANFIYNVTAKEGVISYIPKADNSNS